MILRATFSDSKADQSFKGKTDAYYNANDDLKDKGYNKDQNLEDYGKDTGINAKKETKSHDIYVLMVRLRFITLIFILQR